MQTLFIDRKNTEIEVDGGRLIVRIGGVHPNFSVPVNVLEFLVISAAVSFSSNLITKLNRAGITTVFINPRQIDTSTMTHGMLHNNAERRLLQYQAVSSAEHRQLYSRELVRGKLRAQRAMLMKALRKRPDCRYKLTTGIERLGAMITRLEEMDNVDSLRGVEGAAGAAYFEAYQAIFPPSLNFTGRNRRPPLDPVNVILSLSFTLLHAEAVRVLFSTGFDPLLGIYHAPTFGRESLACDMVESFRPLAEHWVWRLFAEETLRADHFSSGQGVNEMPCMLGKAGRAIYYASYESMAVVWRRLMRRAARAWLNRVQQDFGENSNHHLLESFNSSADNTIDFTED